MLKQSIAAAFHMMLILSNVLHLLPFRMYEEPCAKCNVKCCGFLIFFSVAVMCLFYRHPILWD